MLSHAVHSNMSVLALIQEYKLLHHQLSEVTCDKTTLSRSCDNRLRPFRQQNMSHKLITHLLQKSFCQKNVTSFQSGLPSRIYRSSL